MQTKDRTPIGNMPNDDALRRLWNVQEAEMSDDELAAALDVFRGNRHSYEGTRRRKRRVLRIVKYAAALAMPLVAAFAAWNYSADYYAQDSELVQCYVPEGRIDSLVLSDNTKVKINAGTSVLYPVRFSSHSRDRNVYVTGNCHFDVAKDRMHPFVVNLGSLKVKVLGTHFSVNSYNDDDDVTVTLEEGLVRVYDSHRSMMLHPNEQLVYNRKTGSMRKSKVDALAVSSWTVGSLDFAGQPLSEIVKTLERRYGVKIRVEDGVDVNRRYTMNFKKDESVENVMKVLSIVSGNMGYRKKGDVITLYKN